MCKLAAGLGQPAEQQCLSSPTLLPCLQLNKFRSTPGATTDCTWCPRGKETRDTGNSECTDCAIGYYNPKTATSSDNPACIAAPAGTFVNTTGAFFATQW